MIHIAKLQPIYKKVVESYSLHLDKTEVEIVLKSLNICVDQIQSEVPGTHWTPEYQTLCSIQQLIRDIKIGIQLGEENK